MISSPTSSLRVRLPAAGFCLCRRPSKFVQFNLRGHHAGWNGRDWSGDIGGYPAAGEQRSKNAVLSMWSFRGLVKTKSSAISDGESCMITRTASSRLGIPSELFSGVGWDIRLVVWIILASRSVAWC